MRDAAHPIARRRFLGGVALTGAALALPGVTLSAATLPPPATGAWDDHWLKQLKARHRVIFDCQTLSGDLVAYPGRYLDAMLDGYGAKPDEVQILIGLSGKAWPAALDNERWAKYSAGHFTANGSRPVDAAAIAAFQKRGATFLVCDDALLHASQDLVTAGVGSDAAAIHADLRAGLLPGIIAVPAMPAAIALAQQHHCAYIAA